MRRIPDRVDRRRYACGRASRRTPYGRLWRAPQATRAATSSSRWTRSTPVPSACLSSRWGDWDARLVCCQPGGASFAGGFSSFSRSATVSPRTPAATARVAWTSATWTCRAPLDERQGGQEPLRVGEVLARGGVGWLAVHGPDLNSGQGPGLVCRAPAGAASWSRVFGSVRSADRPVSLEIYVG